MRLARYQLGGPSRPEGGLAPEIKPNSFATQAFGPARPVLDGIDVPVSR